MLEVIIASLLILLSMAWIWVMVLEGSAQCDDLHNYEEDEPV